MSTPEERLTRLMEKEFKKDKQREKSKEYHNSCVMIPVNSLNNHGNHGGIIIQQHVYPQLVINNGHIIHQTPQLVINNEYVVHQIPHGTINPKIIYINNMPFFLR